MKRWSLFGAATVALLTVLAATATAAERNLIVTEGSAEVTGQNDSASISLSVLSEGRDLEAVSTDNATTTAAVLKSVKDLGIPGLKLQTSNFRVEPQSDYKARPPRIIGYRVYNVIDATLEGLAPADLSRQASKLIGTALQSGANSVQRLNFYIKDKAPLEKEALTVATREALERAAVLAKAAGVSIQRIATISTRPLQPEPIRPMMRAAMAADASAAPPPMESGESTVRVQVEVACEME